MNRRDRLTDRAWLAEQAEMRTATVIAHELGCSPGTVLRAMRLHVMPVRSGVNTRRISRSELDDVQWLRDRYAAASVQTIATELGLGPGIVTAALERHGIPIRVGGDRQKFRAAVELHDAEALRQAYESRSVVEVAKDLGVSVPVAYVAMRRNGVKASPSWVRRDITRLKRPSKRALERVWLLGTVRSNRWRVSSEYLRARRLYDLPRSASFYTTRRRSQGTRCWTTSMRGAVSMRSVDTTVSATAPCRSSSDVTASLKLTGCASRAFLACLHRMNPPTEVP